MARNVEIKARLTEDQFARATALADAISDRGPFELAQRDTFFHALSGRLKLREFDDGTAELIFYQRPDQAGPKVSNYSRIPCPDPAAMRDGLAASNGIRGEVIKRRQLYLTGATRIHLDQVDILGSFLELEVVLADDQTTDAGRVEATRILAALELSDAELVERAYIDLLVPLA